MLARNNTTKKKKISEKPEFLIQKEIVDWTKENHSDWVLFSVPNESTYRRKNYFKALGMLSGVSDLVVITPKNIFFIECKAPKGKQRIEQRQFESDVMKFGYTYAIVHSLDEYKNIIE